MDKDTAPKSAAERLADRPSYLPPGVERLPEGLTLGNINTGDLIAVDRRWIAIAGCTDVNGWVTVRLSDDAVTALVAKAATPVHLARGVGAHAAR